MPADTPEADTPEGQNDPSRSEGRREQTVKSFDLRQAEGDTVVDLLGGLVVVGVGKQMRVGVLQALKAAIAKSDPPREITEASDDEAQRSMFLDIDVILARVENGIAAERTAMDALLDRLISKAASP